MIFMTSYLSFTDYHCQLESRIPVIPCWAKDENIAYCEDYGALVTKKSSGKIAKLIAGIFASIVR